MTLKLHDTLTRTKREFVPIDASNVRLYVCGPTVYDFAHIGNARPVIVFDVLFRVLRRLYGEEHVIYVRNITDVDDKINERAARDFPALPLNEAIRLVTETTAKQFHDDIGALGCLEPSIEPRATEHISEMRDLIERLIRGGFAYVAQDHALFSPTAMDRAAREGVLPRYGTLANRSLDEMLAGARVDVAPYKRDPMDFVLWKPSKEGEPAWASPAGIVAKGRPGWHIECSAMSWKHLGEVFDIHGGGIDLVFPHHENEIAQSCSAFGHHQMANYWMHNGFLQVEGQKMSKSLGNFVTINELLSTDKFGARHWAGPVLRLAMLATHYRQPIDWTVAGLKEAERVLRDWSAFVDGAAQGDVPQAVIEPLADDLNTPKVLANMHALRKAGRASELRASLGLLGVDLLAKREIELSEGEIGDIELRIAERNAARVRSDWKEADRIRDWLLAIGVQLKDNKDGTTSWEVKR
ncbi:MAG: cysteine--tRNA ligase [Hyphomicrobiales bacterium]|nr:cysteine--tRNA ligase [Hyphomicrobiales bacterium]